MNRRELFVSTARAALAAAVGGAELAPAANAVLAMQQRMRTVPTTMVPREVWMALRASLSMVWSPGVVVDECGR